MPPFASRSQSVISQIAILTTTRTVMNTGFRMIYPLLPVFARAVAVDIATFSVLLTVLQLMGLSAPFVGQISVRWGQRIAMMIGLLLYACGMSIVFLLPNFTGLALAYMVSVLGKIIFDPALQTYVSGRIPYAKRGFYMGIIEFAWAGAFIIGVPIMTWLIARSNWQAPFAVLAIGTVLGLISILLTVEPDVPNQVTRLPFFTALRQSVNSRMAWAGLAVGFGISGASQFITVVFGQWIEESFRVEFSALAAASVVIGLSELGGQGVTIRFADRIGKRRLVILGILSNILACLVLPWTALDLTLALCGLFFFFLTFEASLVSLLPLASELNPAGRAMYMTVLVAAITLGRTIATPLATLLYQDGLWLNSVAAIGFNLIALVAVWRYIRDL